MKVQKIKLSPYDYTWLVLDDDYLPGNQHRHHRLAQ